MPDCRPIVAAEMGRGGQEALEGAAVGRRKELSLEPREVIQRHRFFVSAWQNRIDRALRENPKDSIEEQLLLRVRALRGLTTNSDEQRKMIAAAQELGRVVESLEGRNDKNSQALRHEALRLRNMAREMFTLCHYGWITQFVRKHVNAMESESDATAMEILRQEAFIEVMTKAIDMFDLKRPLKPLTYARNWVHAACTRTVEHGGLVRLKSKRDQEGQKLEQLFKRYEDEKGRQPSLKEICEELEISEERALDILPWARGHYVRLDKPVSDEEGGSTVGNFIVDPSFDLENSVVDANVRRKVREAVAELPPGYRRIIETMYLSDYDEDKKKTLFDGVYRDKDGNAYSAQAGIIRDRAAKGEKVTKMLQSELNKKFEAGEMVFEPGTPEAHMLARIGRGDFDPATERFEGVITRETGVPPSSGTVESQMKKALALLAANDKLKDIGLRYRGDDELEHSNSARREVLKALLRKGAIREKDFERLNRVRTAAGGKSELRQLAEKHGFVDPDTGRLRLSAVTAASPSTAVHA